MKKLAIISAFIGFSAIGFAQQTTTSKSTSRTAISVSISDTDYNYSASFDEERTPLVRQFLVKELGKPTQNKKDMYWILEKDFKIRLKDGKLRMECDTWREDSALGQKIKRIEKSVDEIINGKIE